MPLPSWIAALRRSAVVAFALALLGCRGPAGPLPLEAAADRAIHVVSNSFHVGIVVVLADIPPGLVAEAAYLPPGRHLEFGWGDRIYYPEPNPTRAMALRAALVPGPAVIHLATWPEPPTGGGLEVLRLALSAAGLEAMLWAIDAVFDRPAGGPVPPVAPGLYPSSLFFPAHGRFHLLNTCNSWVARKLAAGGVAVSPVGVVTAEDLMGRLRPLAIAADTPLSR